MHLVKNLLITPNSPEHCVFGPDKSNSWEGISGQDSPPAPTHTPAINLNCPPGFLSTDAFVCQRGSKKYKQSPKTCLHTTSVSHKKERCWRSQPHAKAPLRTTTAPPSSPTTLQPLSLTHRRAINFAPTQPTMVKSTFLYSSWSPTINCNYSISPPVNLCFSPTTSPSRVQHNSPPPTTTSRAKKTLLVPGMHFWQRNMGPNHAVWSYNKCDRSEEYMILQATEDPEYNFIVQDLRTGEHFDMLLSDENFLKAEPK